LFKIQTRFLVRVDQEDHIMSKFLLTRLASYSTTGLLIFLITTPMNCWVPVLLETFDHCGETARDILVPIFRAMT